MAINETIKDSVYRVWDEVNQIWKRYAFWTKGNRIEYDDGNDGETKHGAINGITSSLASNSSSIAASAAAVYTLNNNFTQLSSDLSFPDGTGFYPDMQNGVAGYNTDRARGADTFVPFSSSVEFSFCLREYGTELSSVRMECSLYSKLQIDNYKFSGNSRTAYIYGIMEDGSRETIATISGSTNPITLNYDISAYTQVEITSPNGGALSTSGDGKLYN